MRKGYSMFTKFRPDIEKWCDAGLTVKEMIKKLPQGYREQGLYYYIWKNGIKYEAHKYEDRYSCDECDYCKRVRNVRGTYNKADNRLCTLSWRLIQYSVKHCPVWCEKGEQK